MKYFSFYSLRWEWSLRCVCSFIVTPTIGKSRNNYRTTAVHAFFPSPPKGVLPQMCAVYNTYKSNMFGTLNTYCRDSRSTHCGCLGVLWALPRETKGTSWLATRPHRTLKWPRRALTRLFLHLWKSPLAHPYWSFPTSHMVSEPRTNWWCYCWSILGGSALCLQIMGGVAEDWKI